MEEISGVKEAKQVLARMKEASGARSTTDLARKLGVAQQSVFNAQAKGKIPDGWFRKIADLYGASIDWLAYGVGNMQRKTAAETCAAQTVDKRVLLDVVEILEGCLTDVKKQLTPKAKAELILQLYQLLLEEESTKQQQIEAFRLIQRAIAENGA